jgi:hypothetical protein
VQGFVLDEVDDIASKIKKILKFCMFTVSSLCIRLFELEISQDENYNIKKNEENNILELFKVIQ